MSRSDVFIFLNNSKMASYHKIVLAFAVLFSVISRGTCIFCYYCNSANNSACLDTNMYDDEVRSRIIPVVNCDTAIPGAEQIPFFCRKIVQTIIHSYRESEVRVTRGCGWVRDERNQPCYRNDNSDHYETVCQCFSDHCNSAESTPTAGVAIFIVFAAVLYFYR